ncbi:MAG: flippase activity-associated protein Agl23 [Chloroflexota bacterium]
MRRILSAVLERSRWLVARARTQAPVRWARAQDWARGAPRRTWRWWGRLPRLERSAWCALMAAALASRLWDVGGRALHYDELLHAWYAWRYADGLGYAHTPLTHGPLLFHLAAGTFKLLGSSDMTARMLPALVGAVVVAMPLALRGALGRWGALGASVLLLTSPTGLYFARFLRNDVYMSLWALVLAALIWNHTRNPRLWHLVAWALAWSGAFATKETAFMLAGAFGLLLLVWSLPGWWAWLAGRRTLAQLPPAGSLLLVLGTLTAPLWAPLAALVQEPLGLVLANPDASDRRVVAGTLARAAVPTGSPAGSGLYIAATLVVGLAVLAVAMGLRWNARRWALLAAAFWAPWLVLHTSFFHNAKGFYTGIWGSLGYWMAQQGVERASQPWYYYGLTLGLYESLTVVAALAGAGWLVWRRRGAFDRFLLGWAVLNTALFVYAGERMPWLTVDVALPLVLVGARALEALTRSVVAARPNLPALAAGALPALGVPLAAGRALLADARMTDPMLWAGIVLSVAGVGALVPSLRHGAGEALHQGAEAQGVRKGSPQGPAWAAVAMGALAVLVGFTAFTAWRASFDVAELERPTELLVFSQTGQETTYAAECIGRVARDSGLGTGGLRVLVDTSDNFQWQWRWYLRAYAQVSYQDLNASPMDSPAPADIVLSSHWVTPRNEAGLVGFTEVGSLYHLWWFPNYAYNTLSPSVLWASARDPVAWRTLARYVFARRTAQPATTYMQRSQGVVYVADALAPLAQGCSALRAARGE